MDFKTPEHYDNDGVQPFDIMQQFMTPEAFAGFCVGNIIKYIMRYDKKNGADDVKKAAHYCEILYEQLTKNQTKSVEFKTVGNGLEIEKVGGLVAELKPTPKGSQYIAYDTEVVETSTQPETTTTETKTKTKKSEEKLLSF